MITGFQSIQLLCPSAIVLLLLTGRIRPWMIVALSVVVGITDALSMPSFQSIVPSLVSHDEIERGLTLNSTQFNLSRLLGPTLAGVLMSSAGAIACFVISAVSYVPFIGVALGARLTGLAISIFGVRHALLLDVVSLALPISSRSRSTAGSVSS
jgi:predicted MFS family arabinose efflux permease